jgi:hypothetical protein
VTNVLEAAPLEQRRQFLPKRLVVAAIRPPISIPPDALVALVARMPGIDRRACPPVGVLVDHPAARAEAIHHLPDRFLLSADEVEQGQARTDQVERARAELVERVLEDVVLAHLEIGKVELLQVAGVDVGRDDVAGRAYLLGHPCRHRASPCGNLETSPARLDQRTPPTRHRVVELLEKA